MSQKLFMDTEEDSGFVSENLSSAFAELDLEQNNDIKEINNTNKYDHTQIDDEIKLYEEYLEEAFTPDEDGDNYLLVHLAKKDWQAAKDIVRLNYYHGTPANLNIRDGGGCTALHLALENPELVYQLIKCSEQGSTITAKLSDGRNIFHLCAENGYVDSMNCIVNVAIEMKWEKLINSMINELDAYGLTPFFTAVKHKQIEVCSAIASYKSVFNVQPDIKHEMNGEGPLHEAIQWNDIDALTQLLNICNVNDQTNYTRSTPLHLACAMNNRNVCDVLLKYGANPNIHDYYEKPPHAYTTDVELQNKLAAMCSFKVS